MGLASRASWNADAKLIVAKRLLVLVILADCTSKCTTPRKASIDPCRHIRDTIATQRGIERSRSPATYRDGTPTNTTLETKEPSIIKSYSSR